ncbi:GNAT family N-acetyltransferase [Microbacterium awajiense]|uniref:GNAT family N-acetyltransferase n=1 Tax=Microbacterium awajiense TaxID=415214 RepID=A0ABP7A8K3_9MICO
MTTTLSGLEIRPLAIPASIDADDAGDFIAMVRVRNAVYREITGNDDDGIAADELLPYYRPDPDERRLVWVLALDGDVVGRAGIDMPQHPGSKNAYWLIELLRRAQGRGVGARAYQLVEQAAREHGRTVLQSWAEHPAADGPQLDAPTGFGSIPEDRVARFYLDRGYVLEQIERKSAFDMRGDFAEVERLAADAERAAAGYRVVQWSPPTPPEFAEGYAWMKSRMNTDAPSANLEFDEEVWDAARIARHDATYTDSGRLLFVTAAQHLETGELCAFNELVIGKDRNEASHQEDTLVLKEHRGHRLGMLVKCRGLQAWRDIAPGTPRVITYNAEENRPMLDINEAIGFVPVSYLGAWKKVLS